MQATDWLGEHQLPSRSARGGGHGVCDETGVFRVGTQLYRHRAGRGRRHRCLADKQRGYLRGALRHHDGERPAGGCERHANNNATAKNGKGLASALLSGSGCGNTLTVRVSTTIDGVAHYTDYTVNIVRTLSLKNLSVSCGGDAVPFDDGASLRPA